MTAIMISMKFDLHIHTVVSDGINKPEEIIEYAAKAGLDGIALTDHDRMTYSPRLAELARKEKLILVPGVEITTPAGDILALGIEKIPKCVGRKDELVSYINNIIGEIHELGGIAVMAHPYGGMWAFSFAELIDRGKKLNFDAIEIFNASTSLEGNVKAMKLARKLKLPGIGGSDAHHIEIVGNAYTISNSSDILGAIKKGAIKVEWL
jgi:hypothetical protein